MFYNKNLLDISQSGELELGFIDNIVFEIQELINIENIEKI